MLFNSAVFLFFFFSVFVVYWAVPQRVRRNVLLAASFLFYGYWSAPFLLHFLAVVLANYLLYRWFLPNFSRVFLSLVVVLNLLNLFFFKYFYLLADLTLRISQLDSLPGVLNPEGWSGRIVLPLAISFYTFQMLAFAVDAYRRQLPRRVSAVDFFLFIMFFPQLIAGPIMRHDQFLPAIAKTKRPKPRRFQLAAMLILLGLVKKVALADSISGIVDPVFASPDRYAWHANLLAVYGFAAQIYCDFSGYTDIARGLAMALGFKIPANFRGPYGAASFREFWRRWHITLSSWLRDYLYIPLGGSRTSRLRLAINLLITMGLGGLWHGANYTFLLWGLLHGGLLMAERALGILPRAEGRGAAPTQTSGVANSFTGGSAAVQSALAAANIWMRRMVVFHLVCFAWIFFRSASIAKAGEMILALGGQAGQGIGALRVLGVCLVGFLLAHWLESRPRPFGWFSRHFGLLFPLWFTFVCLLLAVVSANTGAFLYFQF